MKHRHLAFATGLPLLIFMSAIPSPAQTEARFTAIQYLTNREMLLRFSAPTGLNYRIMASGTLSQWYGFLTLQSTGSLQHTDSAAPFLASRFYQAVQLTGTNIVTGDHLVTTNGEVVIHPVNHASFVLSWNGKTIYNDPVGASRFAGLPRADLILITHTHSDHLDSSALNAVTNANTVIIAPLAVYNTLSTSLRSITRVLTNGAATNVLGLAVEAIPMYNTTSSYHVKGDGNGYVLTIGGRRLYLSGDTEDTSEMRALRGIEIAFLAMNQPYTLSVSQAVSAVRVFHPQVVYPNHYRNADNSFADLKSFKQQVLANPGIEVRLRNWY